jgi:hypothetical protein
MYKPPLAALLFSSLLSAQWLDYPTPGIPRTPDGKPNLTAPAPRTPDGHISLNGIWRNAPGQNYLNNLALEMDKAPFLPWAEALFKERQDKNGLGRPSERCLPHGVTDFQALGQPTKIIQTPEVTIILFESYNHYRQVFTDGRPTPPVHNPAWLGYSVGRWEGDTFVVETTGFNDITWLDDGGHPHTEQLKVTERFRRTDFGHMELEMTVDDPGAYTKPWKATLRKDLMVDTELIEWICENEKDFPHMVGK